MALLASRFHTIRPAINSGLQSQTFDSATWTKTRSSIGANADTAPDGTLSADRLIEDATAGATHELLLSTLAITVNASIVHSVFAKPASRTWIMLLFADSTGTDYFFQSFDVANGVVGTSGGGGAGAFVRGYVEPAAQGYVRCVLVGTVGNGRTVGLARIYLASADNTNSYNGDGSSYVSLWGAQIQDNASFAGEYVPTTTVVRGIPHITVHAIRPIAEPPYTRGAGCVPASGV